MNSNVVQKLFSATSLSVVTLGAIGFGSSPAQASYCPSATSNPYQQCYEITNGRFANTDSTFSGGFYLTTNPFGSAGLLPPNVPRFPGSVGLVTTTPNADFNLSGLTFQGYPVIADYAAKPAPSGVGSIIGGYGPLVTYTPGNNVNPEIDPSFSPNYVQRLDDGTYIGATLSLYTSQTIGIGFTGQGGIYGGSLDATIFDSIPLESGSLFLYPVQTFSIPVLSADITPASVPTPALLPGLVGFSLSLWRQRRLQAV
jgi:hypothetical protein